MTRIEICMDSDRIIRNTCTVIKENDECPIGCPIEDKCPMTERYDFCELSETDYKKYFDFADSLEVGFIDEDFS